MSDDEKKDCLVACKQLFPTRAFKVYNGLFDFKTSAIATKLDSEMWAEADQMMPHEWYLRYGTFLELPDYVEPAMQVTSKAAAASVAEQGVVGWSKVGSIETSSRTRIATSKTSKLCNVGGWQWAAKEKAKMQTPEDRKDCLKLFDALDEYVEVTREEALAAGLEEGADAIDEDGGGNDAEEAEEEQDPGENVPELPEETDEYKQDLFSSEEDLTRGDVEEEIIEEEDNDEDEGEDLEEMEEPSGPRPVMKVNESLLGELPRPVNFRTSQFDSRRTLAFD